MISSINVYTASAGSGKTYLLIKNFLIIIFVNYYKNKNICKNILFITFARHSTNEVKYKLISILKCYSKFNILKYINILYEIKKKVKSSLYNICKNSKYILNNILYDYENISIFTIDEFFINIIKYNIKDINIHNDDYLFNKEKLFFNLNKLLILSKKKKNNILYVFKYIITYNNILFINNNIILNNIFNNIFNIFNNNDLYYWNNKKYNYLNKFDDFINLYFKIYKFIFFFIKNINRLSNIFFNYVKTNKINLDLFYFHDIPNFFLKLKNFNLFNILSKRLINNINKNRIFSKYKLKKNKLYIFKYNSYISKLIRLSINFVKKNINKIFICNNILENNLILYISNILYNYIQKYKCINNIYSHKDISLYLNKMFNNKYNINYDNIIYRYCLIDEFQDTSILQYNNLKYLFKYIFKKQKKILIVGDQKQNIYAWRGSDNNIFYKLKKFIKKYSLKYKIKNINYNILKLNYRSNCEIVKFNNNLYKFIYEKFIYFKKKNKNIEQKYNVNKLSKGYVEIKLINTNKKKLNSLEIIYKNIYDTIVLNVYKYSYNYKDIVILVRYNQQIEHLSKYLYCKGIPIFFKKKINLHNYYIIKIIILIFKIIVYLYNKNIERYKIKLLLLLYKYKYFIYNKKCITKCIIKYLKLSNFIFLKKILKFKDIYLYYSFLYDEIYNICIYIINIYNIKTDKYLDDFLRIINNYVKNYGNSIYNFLKFWENDKYKINNYKNNTDNLVNIITIHKSKGLEFPIVIIPFANWNIYYEKYNNKLFKINNRLINNFNYFSISGINKNYYKRYNEYKINKLLDSINLLYVATTRAVNKMYIYIKKNIYKMNKKISNISDIFILFLKYKNKYKLNKCIYTFGKENFYNCKRNNKYNFIENKNYIYYFNSNYINKFYIYKNNIDITYNIYKLNYHHLIYKKNTFKINKVIKSRILHDLLSKITNLNYIKIINYIKIYKNHYKWITYNIVYNIYNNNIVLFNNNKLYSEKKIFYNNKIFIPDCIFLNNYDISIIEYKIITDKQYIYFHLIQIKKYVDIFLSFYKNIYVYLVYIYNNRIITNCYKFK